MRTGKCNEPAEWATYLRLRANIQFNRLSPAAAGSNFFGESILGLTPQALCCRALRALGVSRAMTGRRAAAA